VVGLAALVGLLDRGEAALVGLLDRGEAVPVPQEATSAAVQNAAHVALGRFDRRALR